MSQEKFLYEKLFEEFGKRNIINLPLNKEISENLNSNFELREYQKKHFKCLYIIMKNLLILNCILMLYYLTWLQVLEKL